MHKLEKIFKELKGEEIFNTGYTLLDSKGSIGYLIQLQVKEELQSQRDIGDKWGDFVTRFEERVNEEYVYVYVCSGGSLSKVHNYFAEGEDMTIIYSGWCIYITLIKS